MRAGYKQNLCLIKEILKHEDWKIRLEGTINPEENKTEIINKETKWKQSTQKHLAATKRQSGSQNNAG